MLPVEIIYTSTGVRLSERSGVKRKMVHNRRISSTKSTIGLLVLLVLPLIAHGQQPSSATLQLPAEMLEFFPGDWSGSGSFANGRAIRSHITFTAELDNKWLLYRHVDIDPALFKAIGLWGVEKGTGKLIMQVVDNFGGIRRFESLGWIDGQVLFVRSQSDASDVFERFLFKCESKDSFTVKYETSREGTRWRLGDSLLFRRDPGKAGNARFGSMDITYIMEHSFCVTRTMIS